MKSLKRRFKKAQFKAKMNRKRQDSFNQNSGVVNSQAHNDSTEFDSNINDSTANLERVNSTPKKNHSASAYTTSYPLNRHINKVQNSAKSRYKEASARVSESIKNTAGTARTSKSYQKLKNSPFGPIIDYGLNMARRYKTKRKAKNARNTRSSSSRSQASRRLHLITQLTSIGLGVSIAGTVSLIALFAYYARELPNPNQLLERSDELSTRLYDRNGNPIFEVYGEKNRQLIKIEDVSDDLLHATLAVEDAAFYTHQGFDLLGMARAAKNTLTGQGLQGGSTLTQQVVKNSVLTQERTISRKIKEFVLALQLESRYSKDQILQMYLNETPYGGQNYGVFTAARSYFNKNPGELNLSEAAYLAGLPQSPSRYSPFSSDPELGIKRRDYVLYLMNTRGWVGADGNRYFIDDEQYDEAINYVIEFDTGFASFQAPHFVFFVKEQLAELFGEEMVENSGLQVTTTLDLELQEAAEEIVFTQVEKANAEGLNVGNGALVAIEPSTGGVLAMVGSKDYFADPEPENCVSGIPGEGGCVFDPAVNVTTALRQPGSSIKPLTYATMLEQGYTASYPFLDVQTKFQGSSPDKPYIPENYDGLFRGPMSMRKSLGNSLNIPAVKALQIVGIDTMLDQAEKMGITTLKDRDRYGLALTLGGGETKLLEMTNAFATFARGGKYVDTIAVLEVKNARGDVIYKNSTIEKQALSEEVSYLINDILSDDGARSEVFGFGSLLAIPGHEVAVKTGTTDDLRDNYAVGYTKDISVGVWVGNNNNEQMSYIASGFTGATPIWNKFIIEFLSGREQHTFEPPSNVQKLTVDALTGMQPFEDFDTRQEWFVKGTEPTAPSSWYTTIEICEEDGLRASDECRDADKTDVETFIDIQAELPQWQVYVDKWIGENFSGKPEYFPPFATSALEFDDDGDVRSGDPKVYFRRLSEGDIVPLEFRLGVEVSSKDDIEYVRIYLDGNEVTKDGSEPFGYNFTFTPDQIGEHEFRAVAVDEDGRDGDRTIKLNVVGY